MPAPGIIERIAAQSMMGADSEEITKVVESIAAQSEEQAEVLRDLEERRQLEERANRENRNRQTSQSTSRDIRKGASRFL